MTYAMREEIFSKEYLSIEDVQELLGMSYDDAARTIRNIKRRTDRLGIRGKLHVQDYLDYFQIPPDRYVKHRKPKKAGGSLQGGENETIYRRRFCLTLRRRFNTKWKLDGKRIGFNSGNRGGSYHR